MSAPIHRVDAFTTEPFAGNPAAVCLVEDECDPGWMQRVAAEVNLSETAFADTRRDPIGLRWFTPTREVELCGHATLATAHVLWERGIPPVDAPARFRTASGDVGARRDAAGWIWLDFPDESASPHPDPGRVEAALGVEAKAVARNRLDHIVEVANEEALVLLSPDGERLAALDQDRGVVVTAPGRDPNVDYVCRYFAPNFGIPEDPATGSIQCALGPWWAKRLGKDELLALQRSDRGGRLRVRPGRERVSIGGQAVTVFEGRLAPGAD